MPKPGEYNQRDRLWQPPGLAENYKSSVGAFSAPVAAFPSQTISEMTGPSSATPTSTRSTTT